MQVRSVSTSMRVDASIRISFSIGVRAHAGASDSTSARSSCVLVGIGDEV